MWLWLWLWLVVVVVIVVVTRHVLRRQVCCLLLVATCFASSVLLVAG